MLYNHYHYMYSLQGHTGGQENEDRPVRDLKVSL